MRATTAAAILMVLPLMAAAQKKSSEPASLAVSAAGVSTPANVLVTWTSVPKVQRYEVARCDGASCALKTTLSAFAPREYRETLTATGAYVYRVTAISSRELPLTQGQATYQYSTTPLSVVLMPPPSGTATPINLCAATPTHINVGMMRVAIQKSAPSGADMVFETWQEADIVGHAVDRAPAGTNMQGGGWTTLATTCDAAARFGPNTSAYGNPAFWFRDVSSGLTPSASYQYRARAVSSKGYHIVNVSPSWQAPAPIPPTMLPPRPPDPDDAGEGIRTGPGEKEMPPGPQTVTITARWGPVSASSSQTVSR